MTVREVPAQGDIAAIRGEVAKAAVRTPTLRPLPLQQRFGAPIALKAESLQRTGSFKARGAAAKLAMLGDGCRRGVVAGSAGNHGQAVAYAAWRVGVPCELFVPEDAPISKLKPAERFGATLHTCAGNVDECVALARDRADEAGLAFVHPFDDPQVIAGQGTLGLELLEDVDDVAKVLVPLGGGGLASGVAIALKSRQPEIEVIGVQVEACPSYVRSLEAGKRLRVEASQTIADGIAVKRPGEWTLPLVQRWLDGVTVVTDDDVADAMAVLLADAKLVVEGAGAVGLAALLSGTEHPGSHGTTAIVISGGNVDEQVLAAIARRSEAAHGRGVALYMTISDRPGSLAGLLQAVANTGASVVDVKHLRDAVPLHIAETGIELILETRGHRHTQSILDRLAEAGYQVEVQHHPIE